MKEKELIENLERVFENENNILEPILKSIYDYGNELSENVSELVVNHIYTYTINKLKPYSEIAQLNKIQELSDEFSAKCDIVTSGYYRLKPLNSYDIIKWNVLSRLEEKFIDLSEGKFQLKRNPIQINSEITLLLAFTKAMLKEFSPNKNSNYRIAQLISDNFSDMTGNRITHKYCEDKLPLSGVTTEGNKKLKEILEGIQKQIL